MVDAATRTLTRALVLEDQVETRAWLVDLARAAFGELDITACRDLAGGMAWLSLQPKTSAATAPTAIALIDLDLPDGSGIDLIRRIADDYPAILPVVVSIFDDDAHLFEAMAAGAQGYLLKDEGLMVLTGRLREIAQGEPPLSPSIARRILAHFRNPALPARFASDGVLTPREQEVLALLGRGLRINDAAQALGLTRHTVAGYVKLIYSKLNISSRAEAALEARRRGLV